MVFFGRGTVRAAYSTVSSSSAPALHRGPPAPNILAGSPNTRNPACRSFVSCIPLEHFQYIIEQCERVNIKDGAVLLREGDAVDALYFVLYGAGPTLPWLSALVRTNEAGSRLCRGGRQAEAGLRVRAGAAAARGGGVWR